MKLITGTVIFAKMAKTAAVEVRFLQMNLLYKKQVWKKTKYLVHNDLGAVVGDKVVFAECKPISKMKKWKIVEIVGKPPASAKATARQGKAEVEKKKTPLRSDKKSELRRGKGKVIKK